MAETPSAPNVPNGDDIIRVQRGCTTYRGPRWLLHRLWCYAQESGRKCAECQALKTRGADIEATEHA